MLPKKVTHFFTFLCSSMVVVTFFQNCAEYGQFEIASQVDDSLNISSSTESHLSHSGVDHVAPTEKIADIDYSPMILDRIGLYNMFVDIFGNEAKNLAAVRAIGNDHSVFGSACNLYTQSTFTAASPLLKCNNTEATLAVKPHVGANVLRQGRVNQACWELSSNQKTLAYALARIDSKTKIPEANDKNALSLFSLFYRLKPAPQQALLDSIKMTTGYPEASTAGWSRALYTVCVSGYWEVL